jgi:hypothetical protein
MTPEFTCVFGYAAQINPPRGIFICASDKFICVYGAKTLLFLPPYDHGNPPFVSTWNTFGQITEMWNISGHQSQHTNTRCTAAALPPAALPSLSMATLAMDPIRSAEAPHDPNRDAQRPGLRKLHLISLFGALKWRQSKN